MKITKVTMTGADDSVNPGNLLILSRKYPFVEWGILVSRNSQGSPRFPSKLWMNMLSEAVVLSGNKINTAGHICGSYVKELLIGNIALMDEIGYLWNRFQRIQINTHGQKHAFKNDGIDALHDFQKEVIFQNDGKNRMLLGTAIYAGVNCSTLFDLSHGTGVLPKEWPEPLPEVRCGYAGGLGPENIEEQLKLIDSKVPKDYELWIDMETLIRSDFDKQFDLSKVEYVLETVKNSGYLKP